MSLGSEVSVPPRLANVSAALLLGGVSEASGKAGISPDSQRLAEQLALLFEDVLVVGGGEHSARWPGRHLPLGDGIGTSLDGIVAALEAAREARVLLVAEDRVDVPVDLLLALTAWPEHDVVAPRKDGQIWQFCALYRRREVLEKAREQLQRNDRDVASLLAAVDCGFIEGDDLAALTAGES